MTLNAICRFAKQIGIFKFVFRQQHQLHHHHHLISLVQVDLHHLIGLPKDMVRDQDTIKVAVAILLLSWMADAIVDQALGPVWLSVLD